MALRIITTDVKNQIAYENIRSEPTPAIPSATKLDPNPSHTKQIGPFNTHYKFSNIKSKYLNISSLKSSYFRFFDEPYLKKFPKVEYKASPGTLLIREKSGYEIIEAYTDKYPLLDLRKSFLRIKVTISEICSLIISNSYFEYLVIIVIILNTVTLAASSNMDSSASTGFEDFFFMFYSVECIMKIFSLGFVMNPKSYLRESWNILDFIIVITAWIDFIFSNSVNLQAIRAIRVLRPLRSISSIEGMRVIFVALVYSFKPLLAALTLFLFLISIFAVAGLQLWGGLLKFRCMELETGVIDVLSMCGGETCAHGFECVKTLDNPNFGITNFDNFLFSALTVYQCITLEGWTGVMVNTQMAFNDFSIILFIPLVFIGAFIFLNLTLAIIKSAFSKSILITRPKNLPKEEEVEIRTLIKHLSELQDDPKPEMKRGDSLDSFLNNSSLPMIVEKNMSLDEEMPDKQEVAEIDKTFVNNDMLGVESYITPTETRDRNGVRSRSGLSQKEGKLKKAMKKSYFNDEETVNHITHLLSRIEEKVTVNKKALEKIKIGDKFDSTTINITLYNIITTSSKDIKSKVKLDSNLIEFSKYSFNYRHTSEPIHELLLQTKRDKEILIRSYFKHIPQYIAFKLLLRKFKPSLAFFMCNPRTQELISQIRSQDNSSQIVVGDWSGKDVLEFSDLKKERFSNFNYQIWHKGLRGYIQMIQYPVKFIIYHQYFNLLMTLCILANTAVLSMDHYGISNSMDLILQTLNNIFTNIFIAEMALKVLGIGLIGYLRDIMNYFDGSVVILSIVENIYLNRTKSAFTAFRVVRIFRILRVLRVARLFRYLKSMTHILQVLGKSMSKFIYLFMLLMLFLVIYSLIGIQIFANKFTFNGVTSRGNFDTFHWSFTTNFQVLSVENWQTVLWDGMRSDAGYSSCLFFISWIFIGNYVILNLFLAILLDSFSEKSVNLNNELSTSLFTSSKKIKKREEKIKIIENLNSESEDETGITPSERGSIIITDENFQEISVIVFNLTNPIRRLCIKIYKSDKFEIFIMILISCTSLKLAIDTYIIDASTSVKNISNNIDIGFTLLFFIEFIIKSISLGFVFGPKAYLKDYWNHIDFLIIILSIIDFSISNIQISQFKVIRLLRTLRPLRYISHNLSMKIVVTALLESLIAIFNVAIVLLIVWLMFAILGFSLFSGKLYNCSNSSILTQDECMSSGFEWQNEFPNYDNILNAMIALFILSSEEGWPNIMTNAIDGVAAGEAPKVNSNQYLTYYFIIFIMVSSFFFMNLFTAVVFEKFTEAKDDQSSLAASILTKDQILWIELQQLIVKSTPAVDFTSKPENRIRAFMYAISKNIWFKITILVIIVLNMVQMAMVYDEADSDYTSSLDVLNLVFTVCFITEAVIKLLGYGFRNYLKSGSNKFDFFVVITSTLDLILTYTLNSTISLLRLGPQLIRIIRVFRVSRLVRLFKSLSMLKNLIDVIGFSLPAILNVMSLLLLIFYIYAVLGVNLFYSVNSGIIIGNYVNFSNFGNAMITLFRCSTGEDWYNIMKDCSSNGSSIDSYLYFISFITITTFIMLNLFIMVIIQNYEEHEGNPESVTRIFSKEVKKIKLFWSIYSKDNEGSRIHYNELPPMMQEMEELGVQREMEYNQIMKILSLAELHPDSSGYVYYNDFLFALLRKKYFKRTNNVYFRKIMVNEESKTKKILNKLIKKERSKWDIKSPLHGQSFGNLFMTTIFIKTIFKEWKMYAAGKKNRRGKGGSVSITPIHSDLVDPGSNSLLSEF